MIGGGHQLARGFTLIEMLVVIVIMGLALSITAGFVARPNTALELSGATARVAGALRLARMRAITEGQPVATMPAVDGHGLQMGGQTLSVGPNISLEIPERRPILFFRDGSASGGTFYVSARGMRRVLQVDWLTGRVSETAAP